jgi:hypothetical protein
MTPSKAQKTSSAFRMRCSIETTIGAQPDVIWRLLTDVAAQARWNSTVSRIAGEVAAGRRLELEVPSAPGRVFRPKVARVDAGRSMVWQDGMAPMFRGIRTFTLVPNGDGTTRFAMAEEFSGLMLPLIKGSLPDFGPVFERYAADLKRAAEVEA